MIKSTTTGTTTDKEGRFELKGVSEKATLVFSIVGYASRQVKLSAATTVLSIVLQETDSQLQEVVVTGYQNVDRKLFTGASLPK